MRLHLWEFGEGEPLVCLHGVTEYGGHFRRLAAALPGRRVLAPDLRGHGRSGAEPPWSLEQQLEDVLETVGEEARDWVGHSFGGRLCVELANARPELVRRLVLLDPAFRLQPANALRLAETDRQDAGAWPPAVRGLFHTPQELLDEERDDGNPGSRSRSASVAMFGELARPSPPFPRVPTLLVLGREESVVGPRRRALYAEALGPLLETVLVPGGHTVLWDALPETSAAVARFLA